VRLIFNIELQTAMQEHRHTTTVRKLVAIMFTDIVGYTVLMGRDEVKAVDMLTKNQVIHKSCIEKFNGTLVKEIGDGILAIFPLASDAVRCAIEIQRACSREEIPLKIGIHEGETIFSKNDILGDTVNIASRLQESSKEGCIYISDTVYRSVKNKSDIHVEFIEERALKNVDEILKIYNARHQSLSPNQTKETINNLLQTREKSIIVLPFENMSPDPDQEYFSDGLTEEIITDLSYIHDLLVISRSSAMTFKGTRKKIKEIVREVNVRYVLEGSVRKAGNNLRITAQLIDAKNDAHLWAKKYNGTLDDVFDIQEKVSRSIVDALKIKLAPEETQKMKDRPINNFQAYDLHIKAQNLMLEMSPQGFERAIQCLEKGLEILGDNEILYADLCQVYLGYLEMGISKEKKIFLKAEEYIDRIFLSNPNSSHGYYLKAHLNRWKGNINESIINYKKALSIEPNHFYAKFYLAWLYAFSGKVNEASVVVARLTKIDPLNPMSYTMTGIVQVMAGHFHESIELMKKGNELEKNSFFRWWLAKCLAYNNNINESKRMLENLVRIDDGTHWIKLSMLFLFALKGEKSTAFEVVTKEFKEIMKGDELYPIWMAECYAILNEIDESLKWIEEGINNHFINYFFLNQYNPFLENLRKEKRFKKLMENVKYKWQNFEV
jgi:TolB-like protein